jgi:hypothetical protein
MPERSLELCRGTRCGVAFPEPIMARDLVLGGGAT